MAGWIALRFLNDPATAFTHFAHVDDGSSDPDAATLYALVGENGLENTQVVLTGVTPGGEFKFASRSGYGQASRGWGFFGSLFGGPYYNSRW